MKKMIREFIRKVLRRGIFNRGLEAGMLKRRLFSQGGTWIRIKTGLPKLGKTFGISQAPQGFRDSCLLCRWGCIAEAKQQRFFAASLFRIQDTA
jgi:hypothetical protein